MIKQFVGAVGCLLVAFGLPVRGQSLPLPPRAESAPNGAQLRRILEAMPRDQREAWLFKEICAGNVPSWNRTFKPISFSQTIGGTSYSVTFKALPEYLAVGSDTDYFLMPMTPLLGQRLADKLGCILPTRRLVNFIWTNSSVKLNPQPIPPSAQMTTIPVFADHNQMVRQQRDQYTNAHPFGAMVSGHKKDVIISARIYTNFATAVRHPVVIYGWQYTTGVPIQPLYNGHEETYADYSHGIRLLNKDVSINGTVYQVTNILMNPLLAPLLSDDGTSEGTTNGVIPIPRYQLSGAAPILLENPRSSVVPPGQVIRLQASAVGDEPLSWKWLHKGVVDTNWQTNVVLITNAAPGDAGEWTVAVSNAFGGAVGRPAVVTVREPGFPVLFYDDFEGQSVGNWIVRWGAVNGIPDYTADLEFNHEYEPSVIQGKTELIPVAPNSSGTGAHAARLTVNSSDGIGAVAAANVFSNVSFSNDFALKMDCWINYPGGAGGINSTGSTQHVLFGINHSGTLPAWNGAAASDGLWFAMSGEGGDSRDYRAYQGGDAGAIELPGADAGLAEANQTAPFYQQLFPSTRFETPGAPGKQWVQVELRSSNNIVSWLCDDTVVASRTNNSGFTSGSVMFGLNDFFASIANPAADSFVLIDNVRVEDLSGLPRILSASYRDGEFRMVFSAIPGCRYGVWESGDLKTWSSAALLTSAGGPVDFEDLPLETRMFYRVEGPLP